MPRVKCSVLDRNKEKGFSRIATRGVVKFFNVCNQEQKEIENKLSHDGLSERKRDKILGNLDKGSFLDRLKKDEEESQSEGSDEGASDQENQPSWSVLKDNFIMGGKVKNWDRNVDEKGVEIDLNADLSEGVSNFKNKNGKVMKRPRK